MRCAENSSRKTICRLSWQGKNVKRKKYFQKKLSIAIFFFFQTAEEKSVSSSSEGCIQVGYSSPQESSGRQAELQAVGSCLQKLPYRFSYHLLPLLTSPAVWKLKHSPQLQGNTTFPIIGTTWTLKGSINSSSESSRANTDPVAFLNGRIIYFLQAKASNQLLAS